MKTREELIDEMAKAIYATGVALDGTDYAFGVYDDDDHFHRMASALIAAGIGDVTEYKKTIRDLNTDVVAYRALSKADTLEQIIEGQKSLIDEYKHRAEVAERALLQLCEETMRDKLIIMYPVVGKQVRDKQELYDYCIEKAERELAEEGKDD